MQRDALQALVRREADLQKVSSGVIAAIVTVESAWNPWAMRHEPGFSYVKDVDRHAKLSRITKDTERVLQRTSFGLMQLMGGTARHLGFTGPLATLLDPEINAHWGIAYFQRLTRQYDLVSDQIAAYNAGIAKRNSHGLYVNQSYVEKVSKAIAEQL